MKTPTDYFNSLEGERKKDIKYYHKLIRTAVPTLKPYLQPTGKDHIVGYGKYSYKTKSGCEGEWFTIGVASRKQGISLYVVAMKDGAYLVENNAKKLGNVKTGKSCITFKKRDDLNEEVFVEMIKEAVPLMGSVC